MDNFVYDRWHLLAGKYVSGEALINSLWEEIRKKYSSSRRQYHNLAHIEALLRLADQYQSFLQDKDAVDFAIFYHDIIYNVVRKDNEPRSAAVAVKRLTELGVTATRRECVSQFIEATQTHTIPSGVANAGDLAWLLDFDMSILAAEWDVYFAYTQQVRKEYKVFPDMLYKPGRKQFLEKSLQAPVIFHTDLLRQQWEAAARANMEKELQLY